MISFLALGALGAGLKYIDENAQRELAKRANNKGKLNNQKDESFLNKVNPFLPTPTPTPTPLPLSKEYIYAGSRTLAVVDANAAEVPPADLAIWRPSDGNWWVMSGSGSQQVTVQWGLTGDIAAPGDYDGDGKTDFAIFRPEEGTAPNIVEGKWYIMRSSDNTYASTQLGLKTDKPIPADYDGDGKTDLAVWRDSNGTWSIYQSSTGNTLYFNFGLSNDKPAPADYDGDGKADVAVWRSHSGVTQFYVQTSSSPYYYTVPMGVSSSEPVSADYDGDGKANFAVRNGANWVIMNSALTTTSSTSWQSSTDLAVQNDYDGDGKVDIAVWRDSTGYWYIKNSSDNSTRTNQWGTSGDTPVPALWKR